MLSSGCFDINRLVMGSRGLTGISKTLGSVSHGVFHHSRLPVLVVAPDSLSRDCLDQVADAMNCGGPERDLERYPNGADDETGDCHVHVLEQHAEREHHHAE